jgi:putative RNA 2'-phosphotransferase
MKTDRKHLHNTGKFLSYILRHKPGDIGITLDENGWVGVDTLIEAVNTHKKGYKLDLEILTAIVETNNKNRYAFSDDSKRIRANQGHSVDVDLDLKPVTPPNILYHGTSENSVESILDSGIKKMGRQHVHLSHEMNTATNVGSRHGKVVILRIHAEAMHSDGIDFVLSANGVWLTDYIDPYYIDIIVEE